MTFLSNVAVWISTVMEPAGVEAGTGILSTAYVKDPDDPAWKDDPGVKGWREFMIKYVPDGDLHDTNYVNAYNSAMALEAVLKACGNDLSTENILNQAYSIKDLELPMLLPGIKVNTSPTDHVPVDQMQFMRFNGKTWERFGELLTGNWKASLLPQRHCDERSDDLSAVARRAKAEAIHHTAACGANGLVRFARNDAVAVAELITPFPSRRK
jgi:hypothetical protein